MRERNHTIDALRAFAALSVMLFHFESTRAGFHQSILRHGWIGVPIFFFISGFVLPLSLHSGGYTIWDWPRLVLKRMIRLEPPYFAAIAFAILLSYAAASTPGFRGEWPSYSFGQIAGHALYLTALLGNNWLNTAFWTLAIEFQFYLLIGLVFPALTARSPIIRLATLAALIALSLAVPPTVPAFRSTNLIQFLPLFAAGILTFWFRCGFIQAWAYWMLLAADVGLLAVHNGLIPAIAVSISAPAVAFIALRPNFIVAWFAALSYPIYLFHIPMERAFNLIDRIGSNPLLDMAGFAFAISATFAAAWIVHHYIEVPAQRLSARIRYRSRFPFRSNSEAAIDNVADFGVDSQEPMKRAASISAHANASIGMEYYCQQAS